MKKLPSPLIENIRELSELLTELGTFDDTVERAARVLTDALQSGHKLLACGNGGSAADASHMTTEFVCRFRIDRRPYPALSLATHGGDLTAIGNDYEFNDVFSRQVKAFGQPGDVLMVFTTSGASENVRRALVAAKEQGVHTIAMLGKNGGVCAGIADIEFIVRHTVTARIQEAHKLLLHTICQITDDELLAAEGKM
jgi:D-sedoheptulose 7-phosphate isomerase